MVVVLRPPGNGAKEVMRDVVTGFYVDVLKRLISNGTVSTSDSVLVVCGGPLDARVMISCGFSDVTITNLDDGMSNNVQDAENLSYDDRAFDLVVVHAGLHHCYSPHRALLEMYRVARRCVVAFEARDSLLMRFAIRLRLTLAYEINAISSDLSSGGVADTGVPNFIYRWTERSVKETIVCFDPARIPRIDYFYDLRLPIQRLAKSGSVALRYTAIAIEPLSKLFALLLPRQCNEFAFAISKSNRLQPWMETPDRIRATGC
jgi:SAM-dependent methyltransferase